MPDLPFSKAAVSSLNTGGDVPEVLERMLAMWNERDLSKVRALIEGIFSDDVLFIDPDNHVVGHPAFEAMVKAFRERFPDANLFRSSDVDAHHRLHRYHWEITLGEAPLIEGFDVVELDSAGKVCRVEGFFGPLPVQSASH